MDQRDTAINQLSKLMDVRVVTDASNQTSVFTNSGIQLVGAGQASTVVVQLAGHAERQLAVQHQSDQIRRRLAHDHSFRTAPPSTWSRTTSISSGQIAADLTAARPDPGAGADPGRSAGGVDVERAVGHRPRPAPPSPAPPGRLQPRSVEHAAGQHDQSDLYRHRDQHPAADITIVNVDRSDRAAVAESRPIANPQLIGVNFSGGMASVVSQLNAALGSSQPAVLQSVRLDAARGRQRHQQRRPSTRPRSRPRLRRWPAAARSCRCLPTAIRCTPARSPAAARK